MKPSEIKEGLSYHNGKVGPRSYSERHVVELNVKVDWFGDEITDGVRYEQSVGAYKGQINIVPLRSFAQWAKGVC